MAAQESATDVHFQTGPPAFGVYLPHRSNRPANASVIDEQVNSAKPSLDGSHGIGDSLLNGNIGAKRLRTSTSGLDLPHRFLKLIFGSRNDGDRHSGGRKSERECTAETASTPGYQSRLADRVFGHQGALRIHDRTGCRPDS